MNSQGFDGAQTPVVSIPAETETATVGVVENQLVPAATEQAFVTPQSEVVPAAPAETQVVPVSPQKNYVTEVPNVPLVASSPPDVRVSGETFVEHRPVRQVGNISQLDGYSQNPTQLSAVGAGLEDYVGSGVTEGDT